MRMEETISLNIRIIRWSLNPIPVPCHTIFLAKMLPAKPTKENSNSNTPKSPDFHDHFKIKDPNVINQRIKVYNQDDPEAEHINNLEGDGCSPSTICYSISDTYYDFSRSALFQSFYKFNRFV